MSGAKGQALRQSLGMAMTMGSSHEEMDVEMKNPCVFGLYYSEHPYVIGLLDYYWIGLRWLKGKLMKIDTGTP